MSVTDRVNTRGSIRTFIARKHSLCSWAFVGIVLLHWAEHLAQAFQIYVLNWPRPEANGFIGLFYPSLVSSEILHYTYAIVMLVGLWILRDGFHGRARQWWMLAFAIQFWHHIEHLLLFAQASIGYNLGGGAVPSSILQFFVPRVELHLFYNAVVTIPMVIAMVVHARRSDDRLTSGV